MKAAYIEKTGPPENIRFGELPRPELRASHVLVKVSFVAADPVDAYIRSGSYQTKMEFPFIIGRDMVGRVEAIGSDVRGFSPGGRVWCNNQGYNGRQGTFSEYLAIDSDLLYLLPDTADEQQAVACVHSATTAYFGLHRARLRAGETIFINGGAGNVGSAVLQMAADVGARVIVTSGDDEDLAYCRSLGAAGAINYKTDNVAQAVLDLAPKGVDVYWDTTNRPAFEQAVSLLAFRGRIVVIAGPDAHPAFPVGEFYRKDASMHGFAITNASASELREAAVAINDLFARGKLQARISRLLPLAEAAAAHRLLEESRRGVTKLRGKMVLRA